MITFPEALKIPAMEEDELDVYNSLKIILSNLLGISRLHHGMYSLKFSSGDGIAEVVTSEMIRYRIGTISGMASFLRVPRGGVLLDNKLVPGGSVPGLIVLCFQPGHVQPWVTWFWHTDDRALYSGRYFHEEEPARVDFKTRKGS